MTFEWTRRKRSKANRASTRSENFVQEIKWHDTENRAKWHADINADHISSSRTSETFNINRRHTTHVLQQFENRSSTSNYFQDACISTNQDHHSNTTAPQNVRHNLSNDEIVKPKTTYKTKLVIVNEILHIKARPNRKVTKSKSNNDSRNSSVVLTTKDTKKTFKSLHKDTGNRSTDTQQNSQILSTNQKNSLLSNNTNSLVGKSESSKISNSVESDAVNKKVTSEEQKNTLAESKTKILDVDTQAIIESRDEITTSNNHKAISDDSDEQQKKTVQHGYFQKVKQNYENQDKTISHDAVNIVGSNEIASVELEDKPEKNILDESKTKIIDVNTQEVIKSINDITTSNNQNAMSEGQGKKTLQDQYLQKVKQNNESRDKAIALMSELEDEREKINLRNSNVTTTIVDAPPAYVTIVSTTQHNNEVNLNETIFKEMTTLLNENEVQNKNVPISDQVVKSGNVENDEGNLQCQYAVRLDHKSINNDLSDPVILPTVCDNVKLQTTEVNVPIEISMEAVGKGSKLKHLIITNPENEKVGKVEEESNPSERTEFEICIVKLLQDDQTSPLNSDDKHVHVEAIPLSPNQLEVEKTAEKTIFLYSLSQDKNRKAFIIQDSEQIGICVNKAEQEDSTYENTFCNKVEEQYSELTSKATFPHNDGASKPLNFLKDQTSLLNNDGTVKQKDPEGLYYSEDEIKTEDITSNNLFKQKLINESDNVSKPWKDETDNLFEDVLILEEPLPKEHQEDNVKTLSLPVSIPENKTNSSPSTREELELIGQKITVAKKIEEIKCKAEPFREEIEAFFELKDSNKYFYIEESLQRLVAKLDDMSDEIGHDEWLRQRRKFVYKFIFSLFDALDEKVKINARNV